MKRWPNGRPNKKGYNVRIMSSQMTLIMLYTTHLWRKSKTKEKNILEPHRRGNSLRFSSYRKHRKMRWRTSINILLKAVASTAVRKVREYVSQNLRRLASPSRLQTSQKREGGLYRVVIYKALRRTWTHWLRSSLIVTKERRGMRHLRSLLAVPIPNLISFRMKTENHS